MQHLCPDCSSDSCERVRPEGVVQQIARTFGWHVYRCLKCQQLFYDQSIRSKRLIASAREVFELGKAELKAVGERLNPQASRLLRTLRRLLRTLREWRRQ